MIRTEIGPAAKKERFKLIPAVHLLLIKKDEILLLLREGTGWMDGFYSVPAGHLDGGEPASVGTARETLEEIGVKIEPADFRLVHVMHRQRQSSTASERIDLFFTPEKWSGEPENIESEKCGGLKWFPLDNLPENMVPYVKSAIEKFRQGDSYSEFGWE